MWLRWTTKQFEKLRPGIDVIMDESSCTAKSGEAELLPPDELPRGIHALDVGYHGLKPQLEKCREVFDENTVTKCSICRSRTPATGVGTLICPSENCRTASHLQCLSSAWLGAEGESAKNAMVPTSGSCPTCHTKLMWVNLVKDLSLRMRGEKEIKAIFKPKRGKKTTAAAAEESDESPSEDDLLDDPLPQEDEWHQLLDSSDDDEVGTRNAKSDPAPRAARFKKAKVAQSYSEPVIQDSDSDGAEILH